MRKLIVTLLSVFVLTCGYAGDLASLVNLGFSADGTRFVFGQYGSTDNPSLAYADIFFVDVVRNRFLPGGQVSTPASTATASKDSRGVFAALQNSSASVFAKYGIDSAQQGRALYVQAEDEPGLKKISFRDFENACEYSVEVKVLVKEANGKYSSSFYLLVSRTGADGKEVTHTVGLPGYVRQDVKDYLVRRIITDSSGKSLVFVVEKKVADRNGDSIRFMVEAFRL